MDEHLIDIARQTRTFETPSIAAVTRDEEAGHAARK
jgi:hypothetical protein